MSTSRSRFAALLTAIVIVGAITVIRRDESVQAQAPATPPAVAATVTGRFQISAYSGPNADGANPGCYIVDTATGKVWHTRLGAGLVEVTKQPLLGAR
jgi:hypothetical protein